VPGTLAEALRLFRELLHDLEVVLPRVVIADGDSHPGGRPARKEERGYPN